MLDERDLKDIALCKRLLRRAFQEGDIGVTRSLLSKIGTVFMFSSGEFRNEILEYAHSMASKWPFDKLFEIAKESVLGNVLLTYFFVKKAGVVTVDNIDIFVGLLNLTHIRDPLTFDFLPARETLLLDLDERIRSLVKTSTIEKAVELCELFFANGRLERSKETVTGMFLLYDCSQRAEHKFKARIISALLEKRLDLFITLLTKIHKDIEDATGIMRRYVEIYELLAGVGIPVYFQFENFSYSLDGYYNDNFYFARYVDTSGNEHLLMPFELVEATTMQQLFDPETEIFATPKGRAGKIRVHDVYSFRKMREITEVEKGDVDIIKKMSEDEIEERIRAILEDQNITTHSPVEKADIYEGKLLVNNDKDIRDAAMIIKGKGYPRIRLSDVATNMLKAMDLPVQIVFLIHTGVLLDEPREKFTNECNRARKMHCVVDALDLAKLLIAHNKL